MLKIWMMNPYIRDIIMITIFCILLLFISILGAIILIIIYMMIREWINKRKQTKLKSD